MKTKTDIKVFGYHTDLFRHVNHIRYLEFLEEGRWDYFEKNNLMEMLHRNRNIIHVIADMNLKYKKSSAIGDALVVETDVATFNRVRMTVVQKIYRKESGEPVMEAESTAVFINADSGRPAAIGREIEEYLTGSHEGVTK